jgi:hypothetical protein
VLNLYSDGLLACSINVGGTVNSGECPVIYAALGAHTVVTTYSSGSASATETSIEHIEPFSTTTMFTVAGSCSTTAIEGSVNSEPKKVIGQSTYCPYMVEASTTNQYGVLADPAPKCEGFTCPTGELAVSAPSLEGSYWNGKPAYTFAWETPSKVTASTTEIFASAPAFGGPRCSSTLYIPGYGQVHEGGCHENWTLTAFYQPAHPGWLASQSGPQTLAS